MPKKKKEIVTVVDYREIYRNKKNFGKALTDAELAVYEYAMESLKARMYSEGRITKKQLDDPRYEVPVSSDGKIQLPIKRKDASGKPSAKQHPKTKTGTVKPKQAADARKRR